MRFEVFNHRQGDLTGFSYWLRDDPDREGIERVLFKSRDGIKSQAECLSIVEYIKAMDRNTPIFFPPKMGPGDKALHFEVFVYPNAIYKFRFSFLLCDATDKKGVAKVLFKSLGRLNSEAECLAVIDRIRGMTKDTPVVLCF